MAAGKVKVIDLAKELGVTSKDLMVAAEEMGHKGVRAMTPLDSTLANALRVKLGKGRDLPEEPKPSVPPGSRQRGQPRAVELSTGRRPRSCARDGRHKPPRKSRSS